MRSLVLLLSATAACAASIGAGDREIVNFDFSWKHRLGLHSAPKPWPPVGPLPKPNCTAAGAGGHGFPTNASGFQCMGLGKQSMGDPSPVRQKLAMR